MRVPAEAVHLAGDRSVPDGATGLVLFAHGSGSSRLSPRNRHVAGHLQRSGLATLLVDLLTADEEQEERYTAHLRFDIDLLAHRLAHVTDWVRDDARTARLPIGYFGASTGAAAALIAASERADHIRAVVSRGGRPDLAGDALGRVRAPTLLIVGGSDTPVIRLNRAAFEQLAQVERKQLVIVPGATHLFEEPGALEQVSELAGDWFRQFLVQ